MDYGIWSWVEDRTCNRSHNSKKSPKTVVEDPWNSRDRTHIRNICVCRRYRNRVVKIQAAEEGIFEKKSFRNMYNFKQTNYPNLS